MIFQLFLNHLSASQTIKSRNEESAFACYATCSPYNCAIISSEQKNTDTNNRALFERMMGWKIRREDFAYLVYDPSNNRLYETDEEGFKALEILLNNKTYDLFCATLADNSQCDELFSCINEVYI